MKTEKNIELILGWKGMYDFRGTRRGNIILKDQALKGGKILLLLKMFHLWKLAGKGLRDLELKRLYVCITTGLR